VEHHDERPIATIAEIDALADAIGPRFGPMVLLAAWTGLRFGELAGLRVIDLDLARGTVRVTRQAQEHADGSVTVEPPKTAAGRRTIAVPPHILPTLAAHVAGLAEGPPDRLLFPSPEGTAQRRSNFRTRYWLPAVNAVGIPELHFHDLRHTGNTMAASTGASTKELMARMGHASARAALIYQHATEERDHALAAALSRFAQGDYRQEKTAPEPVDNWRIPVDDEGASGDKCSTNVRRKPETASNIVPIFRKTAGQSGGDDGTRTHDFLLAKQVL